MANVKGDIIRHEFDGGGAPQITISDSYFSWGATTVRCHFLYMPAYQNYWIEWSSTVGFTADLHSSNSIQSQVQYPAEGDVLTKDLVGFAPGSVWYFRAVADQSGNQGEQ